jgi:hypothetical protein
MQEMTMLTPYLLTEFHDFSVYLISETQNNFSRDQMGNLSKRVSPRVSTDREGQVGPSPNQVGPEGWPAGPTLAPTDLRLDNYSVQEAERRNPKLLRRYPHKTWPVSHLVTARPATSMKLTLPSRWNQPCDLINTPIASFCNTHTPLSRFPLVKALVH